MNKTNKISSTLFVLAMMFVTSNVNAALVNFEITGIADFWADSGNVWGLALDDQITATGTFDDNVLSGGTGTIDFSQDSGNSFTIAVGSITYFESDDSGYASLDLPTISLLSGSLDAFNFSTTLDGNGFDSFSNIFDGLDLNGYGINGTWNSTVTLSPVPVPAAVWLFGSGLIGLAGVARRKAA